MEPLQTLTKTMEEAARRQLHFLDKAEINFVEIPGDLRTTRVVPYATNDFGGAIPLEEYADYFDLKENDVLEEKAIQLGMMCASAYNALLKNAMRKYGWGLYTVDLFKNNVRFVAVGNSGPSIADPAGIIRGWMAYRFLFGAGTVQRAK
jgi:hypothetical protein